MSEEQDKCPRCGTVRRLEDSEGLCPSCLLGMGMLNALPDGNPKDGEEVTPSGTVLLQKGSAPKDAVEDTDNLIGKTLGVYEVIEVLGRGGMGVVYKARDHALDRWVAVKVLAPRLRVNADFIERFLREAQSAGRLSHPNVVPIYGIGDEEGHRFYAMEYVRGVNLAEYLKEQGTLSPWQALNLAMRVASALEAAHVEGIIHRDIKPQNIMIDEAGRVRVLDFGLAKMRDTETLVQAEGGFVGTPSYVSPEQCEGKEGDGRSDLYSLGVVLYECLSGRLPYSADNPLALLKKIVESDPAALSSVRAGVAPEIEDLVHRLLAKNPARRFQSAGELLRSIDQLMDDPRMARGESEEAARRRVFFAAELADVADKHVALFRECLERSNGEALEESDESIRECRAAGRLIAVFADSMEAIHCAFDLQERLRNLGPGERQSARIALHEREASHLSRDSALLPPPEETLGRPLDTVFQMLKLAGPRQILLTHRAFDSARRQPLRDPGDSQIAWLAHGPYRLEELDETLEIYEVGLTGLSPLGAPQDSPVAKSATRAGDEVTLGWRSAIGREIPSRPNWRLEESLGEGGFGEVWLARHKKSQDRRIFKFCFQADRLRALKREVMLLRLLKETLGDRHDISKLLDWNFDQAPFFVESEYTEGGSLTDWAGAQGGIGNVPLETRLEIVAQTARALAAAHSVGVIHKDIKPANVLVAKDSEGKPQAVLGDFGIGLITEGRLLEEKGITVMTELASGRTTSSATGTHLYMAPELHIGAAPSSQSDIYSLGVLFYQMVVGDLSRPAATDWERQIEDPLLSEDLHGCLAGDPADRFRSADQLAERLRTLEQRRARRREREAAERAHARRRMLARAIGAAAAVLLLMALALGYGLYRERVQHLRAKAAREDAEQQLYYSNIALAADEIDESRYAPARQLLLASPPQYRQWEWLYLLRACSREVATLGGHSDRIEALDISPDGKYLLTGSADRTARIWDWEQGAEIHRVESDAHVRAVAFGPQGRRYAVAYGEKTDHERSNGHANNVRVFETGTGSIQVDLVGHGNDVNSIAFSPDGTRLGTASSDGTAKIWDLETGTELVTFRRHNNGVLSIAFDPTGERVVTGGADSVARVWDTKTGNELYSYPLHESYVVAAQFTPDGTRVVSGSADKTVQIWGLKKRIRLKTLKGHTERIRSLDVSADGRFVASAGDDQTIRIWDLEKGEQVQVLRGHDGPVQCVKFSREPWVLASASDDKSVRVWHLAAARSETVLPEFDGRIRCAFSPDGRHMAVGALGERIPGIWDVVSGVETVTLPPHPLGMRCIVYSPDGRLVVTAGQDRFVKVMDASSGKLLHSIPAHDSPVLCVAFSPDGAWLATTSVIDGVAKIWDTKSWTHTRSLDGKSPDVFWADFSPDSSRVVLSVRGNPLVYDVSSGRLLKTLEGQAGSVYQALFSPDGKTIATASSDRTARLWDAESGEELLNLAHNNEVLSLAFSPKGKRLVTGTLDGRVRVWDLEAGRSLISLPGHERAITSVVFSPNGRRLATASHLGNVILYDSFPSDWKDPTKTGESSGSEAFRQVGAKLLSDARAQVKAGRFMAQKPTRSRRAAPPSQDEYQRQIVSCVRNLQALHNALVQYRKENNGEMPDWISDLVPRYAHADTLRCPADPEGVTSYFPDPHMECSYTYDFSSTFVKSEGMTCKAWKTGQLEQYGDRVPTLRCFHHGAEGNVLSLSYGGRLFWSSPGWERGNWRDVKLETPLALLERCAENMRAVHRALVQYRADHDGKMPNWLSDLTSTYLDLGALTCPSQPPGWWAQPRDPNLACGYSYLFANAVSEEGQDYRKASTEELKEKGESVATVSCSFHAEYRLWMTYAGNLFVSHKIVNQYRVETEPYPFPYPKQMDEEELLRKGALVFRQGSYPELNYEGCKDAHITFYGAENNCGDYEVLEEGDGRGGTLDHKKILVSFDLSAASSTFPLARAELRLFNFRERPGRLKNSHTVYVARLLKPWGEGKGDSTDGERPTSGAVTFLNARANVEKWESQGAVGVTDVADAESSATIGGNWPEWVRLDVTESVRHFLAHPEENFGWKISQDNRRGVEDSTISYAQGIFMFKSSEAMQDYLRPTLVLYPPGVTAPHQLWKALLAEARKEFDRLASTFHCGVPVRTPEDARRGAEAWSGYIDRFAPTFHRIDEATRYRDWYQSWLADGAIPDAVQNRSSSEEPTTGKLSVVDLGEGLNLDLVWIPTGEFIIGSPVSEEGRDEIEGPQTWVPVKGFWTGKYEITVGQFRRFVEETSYETDAEKAGESQGPSAEDFLATVPGLTWRSPGFAQTDSHPVVCVSWNDAMAFCRWLFQKTGTSFTLPTEAQAEYAYRAGSTTAYLWGDEPMAGKNKSNLADRSFNSRFSRPNGAPWDDGYVFTALVGSFPPNAWGLYERIGNVNEWCLSLEKPYPYRETDGRNDPEVDGRRAMKGGSCCDGPGGNLRPARRIFREQHYSSIYDGFRVVQPSE